MTDKLRPPYEIALMHDHILRLEEELKAKEQECERLKKTLTEIKVLSENVYCLTNALNRDMALFAKQIIQKISEVVDV